jgi:hypothetical protein
MTRLAALPLLLAATGCVHAYDATASSASTAATEAAVSVLDDPATKAKLADLAASTTAAARDEALGPATTVQVQALETGALRTGRAELLTTRDALLDPRPVRAVVRATLDEATGPATQAELVALEDAAIDAAQVKVDAVVDELGARLAKNLTLQVNVAKGDAAAEVERYRVLLIGAGVLVVAFIALHVAREVREWRRGV